MSSVARHNDGGDERKQRSESGNRLGKEFTGFSVLSQRITIVHALGRGSLCPTRLNEAAKSAATPAFVVKKKST